MMQDFEMLAEYDLTNAVRGRRHSNRVGIELQGVQFLTNSKGQKTAVLVNLDLHEELWNSIAPQFPSLPDFQFLIDSANHSRSVFLDFSYHLPIWQALYDRIIQTMPGYDSDRSE